MIEKVSVEMTRKERNQIIKYTEKMTNKELEDEYYRAVENCLGSRCDEMYEMGYDILDIVEREKYEKYLIEIADLLEYICEQRGINLWERSENNE